MYLSINMEKMEFCYKHPEISVLFNLAHIEQPTDFVRISDEDSILKNLTELERKMLVRKYVPEQIHGDHAAALCGYVEQMSIADVDEDELEIQAKAISQRDHRAYKYVKGSIRKRQEQQVLFQSTAPWMQTPQAQIAQPEVKLEDAPVYKQMTSKARSSNVRDTIWEKADEMWEAAGKPMDVSVVLKLRKEIMNVLEEEGIKRNSASNELGKWQKARLQ